MAVTKTEAYAALPSDAQWSCSFGYPGQGGFCEYFRTPAGERWIVSNGPWIENGSSWSCEQLATEAR